MNEGHVFDVTAEQHVLDNPTHVVIVDVNSLVDRPQAERSEWTMVTIACQTCEWWDETGHKPDDNCITQPSKREGWVPRRPVGLGDPDATFPGAEPVEFNRLNGKRKRWDRIAQAAKVAFTRAKEQWQLEELAYRDRMHAHYQSFVTPRRGLVEMPGIPKPQISDRPWDAPPTDYDG